MGQTQRARQSPCDGGQDDIQVQGAATGLGGIQHEGQSILLMTYGVAHAFGEEVGEPTRGRAQDAVELQDGRARSVGVVSEGVENRRQRGFLQREDRLDDFADREAHRAALPTERLGAIQQGLWGALFQASDHVRQAGRDPGAQLSFRSFLIVASGLGLQSLHGSVEDRVPLRSKELGQGGGSKRFGHETGGRSR